MYHPSICLEELKKTTLVIKTAGLRAEIGTRDVLNRNELQQVDRDCRSDFKDTVGVNAALI